MAKRLLSGDYEGFITQALERHQKDIYPFCLNYCEENLKRNKDMFSQIIERLQELREVSEKGVFKILRDNSIPINQRVGYNEEHKILIRQYNRDNYLQVAKSLNNYFEKISNVSLKIHDDFLNRNEQELSKKEELTFFVSNVHHMYWSMILIMFYAKYSNSIYSKELQMEFDKYKEVLKVLPQFETDNFDIEYIEGRAKYFDKLNKNKTANKENVFNTLPIAEVKEFFKSLHIESNRNGESLLTKEQFEDFVSRAFQGNKLIPPIKLNLKHGDKQRVQYLFYQFKEHCEGITGTNNEKYITLLADNFAQYDFSTVKKNFDKKPDKIYQLPNPLNS